ncbi:DNA repair protein RecN [Leptolyngbya sp. BL0902]|uniref:DNA repair protein RecN n=1 Tax=Leptolyngbya sp. BL0902 TaxID=1115757 RepID=UPI0018E8B9B5|nr:DNA repair protein RecN [Leptolyngbya sp. BL0902]QQE66752.1 DNA repair protein RecN [Leptolyngbya sp. BL0902]
MLTALRIENFALIDALEIPLQAGLTVLTGETGAGKSIILDAIDAVLGGKVNARLVRSGSDKAVLEARFALSVGLKDWFTQQELPIPEQAVTCRREITLGKASVRSRSFLNDQAVTKAQLESLRQRLVEITAQGQTVQIGSSDRQREWLDGFGGEAIAQQRQRVIQSHEAAIQAKRRLEARRKADQDRQDRLELLQLHQQELTQAALDDPAELEHLHQEQQRLTHSVDLQQNSYQTYQILYDSDAGAGACADLLGKAEGILIDMERYDPAITQILTLVSEALTQVEEAGRAINAYGASLEADPQRLEEVEERIRTLKGLCRRFHRTLPELIAYRDEVNQALGELSGEGQSIEALEADYQKRQETLIKACAKLTDLRQKTAQALEAQLIAELKPLAMERVQFRVDLQPAAPGPTGADAIQFLFSPNPGEPLQPLAETASGGEMSRFLLALKACFSQVDAVDTLIFDEIDVGVSGRVAQAIAEKLLQLGQRHQVLCVTHQPMVAALADDHWHVNKQVIGEEATAPDPKTAKSRKSRQPKGKTKESAATKDHVQDALNDPNPQNLDTKTKADSKAIDPASASDETAIRTVVRIAPLSLDQRREELAQLAGGATHQDALSFAEALLSQASQIRAKVSRNPIQDKV